MRLVLTNAQLIDCVNPTPIPEASVTVEQGRIVEVLDGRHSPDTRDAQVIDLQGQWLLPGLWDVHIHPEYQTYPALTVAEQTARFGQNLMQGLTEAGVIGVRTGGAAHFMDVAWRRTFDSGQVIGPRISASGHFLTTTGGHFLTSGHAKECDGPYGLVSAIRDEIKNGVDHIKLNLSGGIMGPAWDRHWHSFWLPEELEAGFTLCRQREFRVMAHATNPEAVKSAVRLGAHSVEHGYIMDEDCLQMLSEGDTWYVPTLAISHLTPGQASSGAEQRWVEQRGLPPDLVQRAEAAAEEHREWFQRALRSGVKMALGSDIQPLRESALLEM
ncbi:MAG: amidohydrolase family protein, partial [Dehalococcoidia bacterium]